MDGKRFVGGRRSMAGGIGRGEDCVRKLRCGRTGVSFSFGERVVGVGKSTDLMEGSLSLGL